MIAIIDYGLGNIGSISNMLKKIGCDDIIYATTKEQLKKADKYILPGVGAFDMGMKMLNNSGMREELDKQILCEKKPILGICLGMQMLGKHSEEGEEEGLGYIDFDCKKFKIEEYDLRVPHMGWDYVDIKKNSVIVNNQPEGLRFYFVHSYYAICADSNDVLMTCDYGKQFAVAVNRDNIFGVQFHPEKSHSYGKWLLKNYVKEVK